MTGPIFRSLDQFTGDVTRSGVTAVLDAADEISRHCTDADRLARDNKMLVRQNQALLARVDELTTGLDEYAETIGDLKAELELTTGRLIAAKDEPGVAAGGTRHSASGHISEVTMRYTVTYEPVKRTVAKSFVCQVCGKKGRKQITLRQTINPFNKNADDPRVPAAMKWSDINAELQVAADAWVPEPIHDGCRS